MRNDLGCMRVVFGNDDLELGHGGSKARTPFARPFGLWRQHHEFGRHRSILRRWR